MTDNASTKTEATLEKLAEDYAKNRVKKPGYNYRLVSNGKGGSKWTAAKIERKA